jgi:hypothetical protein
MRRSAMKRLVAPVTVGAIVLAFALTARTASAGPPAKFYDQNTNGNFCNGVAGTDGGPSGTARWTLDTSTGTVNIRVRGLDPSKNYNVQFWQGGVGCSDSQTIGTLTTDSRGRGTDSFTFSTRPTGWFSLTPNSGIAYATQLITF